MGKGKRNRQLHVEDVTGAERKRQGKKQFVWPVWGKRALCIALLVAVVAGIVAVALISGGAVYRNRIIVESKSGKFDVNQQMATFILWQTMYNQANQEWIQDYYYTQLGISTGSSTSVSKLYGSPEEYGLLMARYYAKDALNSGLYAIEDYLTSLVASADAGLEAGLKFDADDKAEVKNIVTGIKNIYASMGFPNSGIAFKSFLAEYVGDKFTTADIEAAAKLIVMSNKYYSYKTHELQGAADQNTLQDYILKNPASFFETKYFTFEGAEEAMIRAFFTDEFMNAHFKSTVAKYFAGLDLNEKMTDEEKTAKLTELGMNTFTTYTKTVGEDGEASYSPALNEKIAEVVFNSTIKAKQISVVTDGNSAYLIYFNAASTSTQATFSYKEYKYDDYAGKLAEITDFEKLIADCIKEGENVTDYKTDNDKAQDLLGQLDDDKSMTIPNATVATTTKPVATNDPNTVPKSILDVLYDAKTTVKKGWNFIVNDPDVSYVVQVTGDVVEGSTDYTISYVTFTDDLFAKLLGSFEAEFKQYLLDSKTKAPTFSMTFDTLEEKVVNWLMDENFKELVLTKYANKDYDALLSAKTDSNKDLLGTKLNELGIEVKSIVKTNALAKELDSKLYDYIFNSKNKDSVSVIVGKDDRVFLVYVAPEEKAEGGAQTQADDADEIITVKAGWKEYKLDDYATEIEGFQTSIIKDLTAKDRKDTTDHKSAEDFAKEELDALKKTDAPKTWEGFTTVNTTKPLEKDDTNTAPSAIINKIYPNGNTTTSISVTANTYYQVDNAGTSYIIKVTEINTTTLACKVEYKTFEDSDYYSYFRAIKTKIDAALKEESSSVKYPESLTAGSYQEWLFKSEYKAAQGDITASRVFDRKKDDLTFIVTTDSKNAITGIKLYLVDEVAKQVNDIDPTVYGGYQLYENEKDAQKALDKLKGKEGFELLNKFDSLTITEKVKEESADYPAGYVKITGVTTNNAWKKADFTADENVKNWLFAADRKAGDTEIIKSAKEDGYYVVMFVSTEQAWLRTARTGWVEAEMNAHMEALVKDGGYELNEKAMAKVDGIRGVYVLRGSVVHFRKVDIIYNGADYCLVAENGEAEGNYEYLGTNEKIIINGKNLFDGRIFG